MNIFAKALSERKSIGPKHQIEPGPDSQTLLDAAFAAASAPHHSEVPPFRFVVVEDRELLAEVFLSNIESPSEEDKEKAIRKAKKGPCLVGLILEKSRDHRLQLEHAAAAGAGLMNYLHVLNNAGFAAKTVSADDFKDPKGLYDPECEMILAWVISGTPDEAPESPQAPISFWKRS